MDHLVQGGASAPGDSDRRLASSASSIASWGSLAMERPAAPSSCSSCRAWRCSLASALPVAAHSWPLRRSSARASAASEAWRASSAFCRPTMASAAPTSDPTSSTAAATNARPSRRRDLTSAASRSRTAWCSLSATRAGADELCDVGTGVGVAVEPFDGRVQAAAPVGVVVGASVIRPSAGCDAQVAVDDEVGACFLEPPPAGAMPGRRSRGRCRGRRCPGRRDVRSPVGRQLVQAREGRQWWRCGGEHTARRR